MKSVRWPCVFLCLSLTALVRPLSLQQSPLTAHPTPALQPGVLLPKIACSSAREQTYALYLPANYTAAKRWPVVYVFSPDARGEVPAALARSAAEEFGYIIAASNNSRNGPWKPEGEAAQAVWNDTHDRLSIDDQRVYFAGFSGGARVAARLAQSCKCAQAVFLSGASFPNDAPPTSQDKFGVFLTAGFLDFNYPELVTLDSQLASLRTPHFLRRFDGSHQWPPAEIWREALAFAELLAITNKHRQPDDAFAAAQLASFLATADKFAEDGDAYYSWQYLRATAEVFTGFTELAKLQSRIAALEKNPAVRAGQKREKEEITEQRALEDAVYKIFGEVNAPNADRNQVVLETTQELVRLRDRATQEKNIEHRRVVERARRGVFAYFLESGEPLMDSSDPRLARIYLALAAEARPESPWPQVSLARCDLKMGRKKDALRDLQRAVAAGLTASDLATLPSDYPELAAITGDAELQKLATAASAKAHAP